MLDNNTFILKTTICGIAYIKLPIGQPKVTDSDKKLVFAQKDIGVSGKTKEFEKIGLQDILPFFLIR